MLEGGVGSRQSSCNCRRPSPGKLMQMNWGQRCTRSVPQEDGVGIGGGGGGGGDPDRFSEPWGSGLHRPALLGGGSSSSSSPTPLSPN